LETEGLAVLASSVCESA
jgi:hypothetical protein